MKNFYNQNEITTMAQLSEAEINMMLNDTTIPDEFKNDVSDLLVRLMISGGRKVREEKEEETHEDATPDRRVSNEVTRVCGRKIDKDGNWHFNLVFKGCRGAEWVPDRDCQCEHLISKYLEEHAPKVRTIYVFCRVSSKGQSGPRHVSLGAQENRIMQTIDRLYGNDPNIRVKVYKISASAYKGIPTALLDIGESARRGDTIMIYRVDRLSRNIIKYLSYLDELHLRGVRIFAQDEGLWYHERKLDFIQGILDANKEAELISKRVKMSIDARRARGDECFGGTKYGWRMVREKGVIRKREDVTEQKIIAEIKKLVKQGVWIGEIADNFNRQGLTKRGRKWTKDSVASVVPEFFRKYRKNQAK